MYSRCGEPPVQRHKRKAVLPGVQLTGQCKGNDRKGGLEGKWELDYKGLHFWPSVYHSSSSLIGSVSNNCGINICDLHRHSVSTNAT